MNRYRNLLVATLLTFSIQGYCQTDTLTLSSCHEAALSTSPLSRQEALLSQKIELQNEATGKSNLPILDLVGKGTYQSEVIQIPGTGQFPEYPVIPKEQFNVYLGIKQKIYDGNITRVSRGINDAENLAERNQLAIDLDQVKVNINQLYFAALLAQENENILDNIKKTISEQRAVTESGVMNGVILESSLLMIDKDLLSIDQQIFQAKSDKTACLKMLGVWTGQEIDETMQLTLPAYDISENQEFNRPELDLISSQKEVINSKSNMLTASRYPKLYAFGQGGVGQPNPMNFFEVDPSSYYIFGLQLSWNIYDWGKTRLDKQSVEIQQQMLDSRYEDIEHNLSVSLIKLYQMEEELLQLLIKDEEIISLQKKIVGVSESQLNNGVIRSSEYLTEVNNLTDALLKRNIHEVSLSKTRVEILTLTGNL
ncbi:TolC family protein [Bacteroidota bacterium]